MKSRNQITAFYVEALLLILVFVGMILVLTHVFGAGISESNEARILTDSVTLAQNSAEAVAASGTMEDLEEILGSGGEYLTNTETEGTLEAFYDKELIPVAGSGAEKDAQYRVTINWDESDPESSMIKAEIKVFYQDSEEPGYTLETAKYRKGAAS